MKGECFCTMIVWSEGEGLVFQEIKGVGVDFIYGFSAMYVIKTIAWIILKLSTLYTRSRYLWSGKSIRTDTSDTKITQRVTTIAGGVTGSTLPLVAQRKPNVENSDLCLQGFSTLVFDVGKFKDKSKDLLKYGHPDVHLPHWVGQDTTGGVPCSLSPTPRDRTTVGVRRILRKENRITYIWVTATVAKCTLNSRRNTGNSMGSQRAIQAQQCLWWNSRQVTSRSSFEF